MKRFIPALAAAVLLALSFPVQARANGKHAVLPMKVLTASTIYVDNQTNSAELQNTAYIELSKWGQFQIVASPEKADLILRLSSGNSVKFVPGNGEPPAYDPKSAKQDSSGADEAIPPGSTRLSLIDPKTGGSLWSDVRKTDNPKAAAHMLDGLRDAFNHR
jgi:hypothetical protein